MAIDPRIALGVQPLQVQYRDPMASYNQLAQLQSADTQNQLAQMQMQEHQQMAPYRMQQAQTQAASAQLTYDQAKQAQDFITTVMAKAAEHPEAPDNVIEAAQQMMMHGNKQVQDVGAHLLDSYQKVATFKAQLAYGKEAEGAAAPSAMAPAVAVGGINDANAPLVPSGAVQTAPAAAVAPAGIDQGKGVIAFPVRSSNQIAGEGFNDTIRITPDIRINGKFQQEILDKLKNYGETASLKEFPGMRWSLSPGGLLIREPIPEAAMDNKLALAAQGAPPESVNELAAKAIPPAQAVSAIAPAALQAAGAAPALPAKVGAKTAADLMAEIEAGDKKYAPFGVPIPNWKLKRDLLVKQLDEASKPPVMHVVGSNLVGPAGNLVYQGTPDMDFKEVVNQDGTTNILAIDKKKGTSTLVMQDGVAVAGVNPAMADAALRIQQEKEKLSFEQSKFEYEKQYPNHTLEKVSVPGGKVQFVSVNNKTGEAVPVTMDGKAVSGLDIPAAQLGIAQGNLAAHQAMVGVAQQRLQAEMQTGNFTPETIDFMAETYRQTGNLPPLGMGAMAAAARSKILTRAGELAMGGGKSAAAAAADVASSKNEQAGAAAAAKAVGSQIANVNLAATEVKQMIPVLQSYVAKVNPSDYPTLNAAGNYVASKTGDPNIVAMAASMNALVNTYARAINPKGAPTVSDKDHAREILNAGMSKGQINSALDVINREMAAALASGPEVRASMRPGAAAATEAMNAADAILNKGRR